MMYPCHSLLRISEFETIFYSGSTCKSKDETPAEVSPAGLVLRATRHPGHRDGLPGGRGFIAGHLPPRPLSGGHGSDPW